MYEVSSAIITVCICVIHCLSAHQLASINFLIHTSGSLSDEAERVDWSQVSELYVQLKHACVCCVTAELSHHHCKTNIDAHSVIFLLVKLCKKCNTHANF